MRTHLMLQHFIVATIQLEERAAARTSAERRRLLELFASQDADSLASQRSDEEFAFGVRGILKGVAPNTIEPNTLGPNTLGPNTIEPHTIAMRRLS